MKKWVILISFLCLILFGYKNLFLNQQITFGDSPYFEKKGFLELINKPLIWTERGWPLGGVDGTIFLYPILLLMGIISPLFNYQNEIIVRFVFYFPAIIFSFLFSYLFGKKFLRSTFALCLLALFYSLNTYFLMLIDGGQAGVILSYGIFPLTLYFQQHYLYESQSKSAFFKAVLFTTLLGISDPRICLLSFLFSFLMSFGNNFITTLKLFSLLGICFLLINSYWILPLLFGGDTITWQNTIDPSIKWIDAILLRHPLWPTNLYGVRTMPSWFFIFLPMVILTGVIINPKIRKLGIIFILFMFLSAGWIDLGRFPFAFVFRDTTKFFIPNLLIAGIAIGSFYEKLKNNKLKKITAFLLLFYLVFLVRELFLDQLHGTLLQKRDFISPTNVTKLICSDCRSLWIPSTSPIIYENWDLPAISGTNFAEKKPFVDMNIGTHDKFNYFNDEKYLDWLSIFGIKYLVLSPQLLNGIKNNEFSNEKQNLLKNIANTKELIKIDENLYRNEKTVLPTIYFSNKIIFVLGSFIDKLTLPSIYLEDNLTDYVEILNNLDPNSYYLYFHQSNFNNLVPIFTKQSNLVKSKVILNQWAKYSNTNYPMFKYQLLLRGVDFHGYFFENEAFFSTIPGEKIVYSADLPKGKYKIFFRFLLPENESEITISGIDRLTSVREKTNEFNWYSYEYQSLGEKIIINIENKKGLSVLSGIIIMPEEKYNLAFKKAKDFFNRSKVINNYNNLDLILSSVDYYKVNPTKFVYKNLNKDGWLINNSSFNSQWKVVNKNKTISPLPIYSTINGYYLNNQETDTGSVYFTYQDLLQWGLLISLVSLISIISLVILI